MKMDEETKPRQHKPIPLYQSGVWRVKLDTLNLVVIDLKSEVPPVEDTTPMPARKKRQ